MRNFAGVAANPICANNGRQVLKVETLMKRHQAESVCAGALSFLADDPERLNAFLMSSGLDPDELLAQQDDTAIRLQALHFIAGDEAMAKTFCESHRLKAGDLQNVLALLDPLGSSAW